jgi:hypothetical protein
MKRDVDEKYVRRSVQTKVEVMNIHLPNAALNFDCPIVFFHGHPELMAATAACFVAASVLRGQKADKLRLFSPDDAARTFSTLDAFAYPEGAGNAEPSERSVSQNNSSIETHRQRRRSSG